MKLNLNKKTDEIIQSAPSTQDDTITLTREELNNILISFKNEIIEEVRKNHIFPIYDSIREAKEQSAQTTRTLEKLTEQMDEIYAPFRHKKQSEAAARLAARKYEEDDE